MSSSDALHKRFLKAFDTANQMEIDIPIDLRLQFYAYYKQATLNTSGLYNPNDPVELRNAFKLNALLQVKHLTQDAAKERYIDLVNETIKKYKLNINTI